MEKLKFQNLKLELQLESMHFHGDFKNIKVWVSDYFLLNNNKKIFSEYYASIC
jgi:hypothetical protein